MSVPIQPRVELFVRNIFEPDEPERAKTVQTHRNKIVNKLKQLEISGKISEYELHDKAWDHLISSGHRKAAGGHSKGALERYDEFSTWAAMSGFSIQPYFNEDETLEGYVRFPDLCLAVYEGFNVRSVFPCSDETTVYSIEDYLDSVEEGVDWKIWTQDHDSITPDWGPHGDVKFPLIYDSSTYLGDEWEFVEDEYHVTSGEFIEEQGQIDIVFKHQTEERYLLVEVKPDRDLVDKAFGQALRYRYQFLSDRSNPALGLDEVDLAIAAPGFHEYHEKAAEEVGIRLLYI